MSTSPLYRKQRRCHPVLSKMAVFLFAFILLSCAPNAPYHSPWAASYPTNMEQANPEDQPHYAWQTSVQTEEMKRLTTPEDAVVDNSAPNVEQERLETASLDTTQKRHYEQSYKSGSSYDGSQQHPTQQMPAFSTEPVSVALLLPLSGPHKKLGEGMLNAAQLALFDVGSQNFKLIPRDTKGTPEGARQAAQSAVDQGVDMILGPLFSSEVKAIKSIAYRARTPIIGFSTDWQLAGSGTYIMGFLPFAQVARVANYATSQGYSKFSVFAPQTDYSDIVIRTLHYSLRRHQLNIAKTGRYQPLQSDLGEVLRDFTEYDTRLAMLEEARKEILAPYPNTREENLPDNVQAQLEELDKNLTLGDLSFDALLMPIGGENLKTVSTLLSHYDVDPNKVRLIGTGLWDDRSLTGEPGLYGAWFAAPDPQLRLAFDNNYHDTYGAQAPRLATLAYDATALAAVVARSHRGVGSPYTHNTLTNPRGFAGIDGIFRFRPDGLVERGLAVLEIQNGKLTVIDPAPNAFTLNRG